MWAIRKPSSLATLALSASIAVILILSGPAESVPVSLDSRSYIDHYPRADPDVSPSKPNPARKPKKEDYEFEFLNPEPNDTWTSGEIVSLSWVDTDLPWKTTFDFTLVPADPDTNPEALEITRRPFLRYVSAMERTFDIVVPYDLITKQQLMLEQEQDGTLIEHNEGDPHDEYQPDVTTELLGLNVTRVTIAKTTTHTDIQSLARLYITAYEGKTNNMLLRKSIFPIVVLKDHKRDWRALLPPVVTDNITSENEEVESDDYVEDVLDGSNTELAYDDGDSSDETNGESDNADSPIDDQMENASEEIDEFEEENELIGTTPNGEELEETSEENSDETTNETEDDFMDMDHMDQEHEHSEHEHESDDDGGEEMEHHGHSHIMDPNHFQNEEDIELWKEHDEEPGYNPPIKVIDAGTIQVTNWIHNRVRFFVGSPYVFSWEFPESGLGLTGEVNVYVEDAYTGQRYDIAAANLPSSVQFMYLHPTAMMMSTNPKKKIYLRARVELDLFKDGNIHRYTAFSKMFFVVRGAL